MKLREKSKESSPPTSDSHGNGMDSKAVNRSKMNGYSLRCRLSKNKSKAKSGDATNHSQYPQAVPVNGCSSSATIGTQRMSHAQSHNRPIPSTNMAAFKSTLDTQCEDIAAGNKETAFAIDFLVSLLDLLEKEESKPADTSGESLEVCEDPPENGAMQGPCEESQQNVIVHSFNGCDEDISSTQEIEQKFSSINTFESQSHESTKNSVMNEHELKMVNGLENDDSIFRPGEGHNDVKKTLGILEQRLLGIPVDQLKNNTKPANVSPNQNMDKFLKAQMKETKQAFFDSVKMEDPEYGSKLEQLDALKESNKKLEALIQTRAQKLSSLRTFHAGLQTAAFQHHTG